MTTDAEATLFAAVRAITHRNFGDDSLAGQHERAKLLEAIEEYKVNSYPNVFEGHELVTKGWYALLETKAAVCDAYMALVPRDSDKATRETSIALRSAVNRLRELQKNSQ